MAGGNVDSLSDLTRDVKDALASDGPRLIEITQRRLAGSWPAGESALLRDMRRHRVSYPSVTGAP